jgi:hypothetical protein
VIALALTEFEGPHPCLPSLITDDELPILKRIHKLWGSKAQVHTLEHVIHYADAICRNSVDRSMKDSVIRREAEAKIEIGHAR